MPWVILESDVSTQYKNSCATPEYLIINLVASPIVRTSQVTKLMVLGFKKPISCKEKKVIR